MHLIQLEVFSLHAAFSNEDNEIFQWPRFKRWVSRLRCVLATDLEADPGLQLPVGVEEAQQSQSGDAVGAASHDTAAARHPTENAVLVIAQQPRATNQRHRAVDLEGRRNQEAERRFSDPG